MVWLSTFAILEELHPLKITAPTSAGHEQVIFAKLRNCDRSWNCCNRQFCKVPNICLSDYFLTQSGWNYGSLYVKSKQNKTTQYNFLVESESKKKASNNKYLFLLYIITCPNTQYFHFCQTPLNLQTQLSSLSINENSL